MKSPVRFGWLVLALGFSGLLTGCVSQSPSSSQRVRSANDFEVVETSTKRTLTPREMAHLRAKVADYLEQQGVTETGDYYVKIFLGEEEGVTEGDWVVVRYTREPAGRFSLLASYPSYYDTSYSTYAYDYYPFSNYGFGRLSFQYYDYPYYGYRHYPPLRRPHHGDRDRDNDNRPDRPGDGAAPGVGSRPSGALKPSFVPANTVTRTRSNENFPDTRQRGRNRTGGSGAPAAITPGFTFSPAPATNLPAIANDTTLRPPRFSPSQERTDRSPRRTNRPDLENATITPRPEGTRERPSAPSGYVPGRPVREVRGEPVARQNQPAGLKPSAPRYESAPERSTPAVRSEPAPVYTPPENRTESDSTSNSRPNGNDSGRPARIR